MAGGSHDVERRGGGRGTGKRGNLSFVSPLPNVPPVLSLEAFLCVMGRITGGRVLSCADCCNRITVKRRVVHRCVK